MTRRPFQLSRALKRFAMIGVMAAGLSLLPGLARACCNCPQTVQQVSQAQWTSGPMATQPRIQNHIRSELTAQRVWLTSILWEDNILPALMLMAEQFTVIAMQQVQIFGQFIDAKHQMETQQVLQKLRAQAHKDYQPSEGLCEFGSSVKSLAASERKSEYNAVLLSQRSQDRQMGAANTAAATGEDGDKASRIAQFRTTFCDPADNNNGLGLLCEHDQDGNPANGAVGAQDAARKNRDIDFVRTVSAPWTLNIDFTDATLTPEEEDVLALASNLYGHKVFMRPAPASLETASTDEIEAIQSSYMDARAVMAKRSVAENSFNAITAMKSAGTPGSKDFLSAILTELGVPNSGDNMDVAAMLGDNPSYYAQMEVLTKKIYQNPDFYTNLYDKPANVERKAVAMQAIGLMQKFDLFKSYLRNEASLSVLLELAITDLQDEIEAEIK